MGLIALGCLAAAERFSGESTGSWAAAIWLSIPVMLANATGAEVDVGLTMFVFLGVVALAVWRESRKTGWIVMGALLLGWAAGTKYLGWVWLALGGAAVAASALRRRDKKPFALFLAIS